MHMPRVRREPAVPRTCHAIGLRVADVELGDAVLAVTRYGQSRHCVLVVNACRKAAHPVAGRRAECLGYRASTVPRESTAAAPATTRAGWSLWAGGSLDALRTWVALRTLRAGWARSATPAGGWQLHYSPPAHSRDRQGISSAIHDLCIELPRSSVTTIGSHKMIP